MDIGGLLACACANQQGNILLRQKLLISFKNYSSSFLISCNAGLPKAWSHLCFLESTFPCVWSSRYCEEWSHGTIATSTYLLVSSFEVKILSWAESSLQNNSSEEINCCRNHPVHLCIPSGCPTECPAQLSLLCPFFSLFCVTLLSSGSYKIFSCCFY